MTSSAPEPMQNQRELLLVGHRYHLNTHSRGVYDALSRRFSLRIHFVDDYWPSSADELPGLDESSVCMWYVRFRELKEQPGFDWQGYSGLRVMYDLDVNQHFHGLGGTRYLGAWPEVFRRNDFQLLVCTGKEVAERLAEESMRTYWMAKAYDPARLWDKHEERSGLCYFGARYRSRRAMLAHLLANDIPFTTFNSSADELNDYLNRFLGCLISNMEGVPIMGFKTINRLLPNIGLRLRPGVEPMFKNFEVAGAGCAPIADWIPELADLGFRDGENMISYTSFDELVEKTRSYMRRPDELRRIGKNAAKLARNRHTWDHRVADLSAVFDRP